MSYPSVAVLDTQLLLWPTDLDGHAAGMDAGNWGQATGNRLTLLFVSFTMWKVSFVKLGARLGFQSC